VSLNNSTDDIQIKRVLLKVSGRVQGVGFRYYTQAAARRRGLVGWVRNNYDGTVAICAEGSDIAINAFLKDIRQGSTSSHVRNVDVEWQLPKGNFQSFFIRS
jgi:acylphosphatase